MLLTPSPRGQGCAGALQKACDEQVQVAASIRGAMAQLRASEFTAVIIDQNLLEPEPLAVETLLQHCRTALPVYVNFALCSEERLVREVQIALRRAEAEKLVALRAAGAALRNELNGPLTGILMSSELALATPALPVAAQEKLKSVCELAQSIRRRLEVG